jgi:DNA-binding NarL/FixJ family response regulator
LRIKAAAQTDCKPLVAVYSAFNDYAHVSAAMSLGVKAYITKRRGVEELEKALLEALSGETYIDDMAQTNLLNTANGLNILTKREKEIFSLVKTGLPNRQIAARLGISHRTVENILSCVYDKFGIRSRYELERL